MPAIQVAKTDTFESQRQKINQIGSALFNITAGGSDLSTGNLKLGDGTRSTPSLSFVSDSTLGLYKSDNKTIGFVSDDKLIYTYSSSGITSLRNLVLQRRFVTTNGVTITDYGSGYDPGTYNSVTLYGGTGTGAKANVSVLSFSGSVTNIGSGYTAGNYSNIKLTGGTGSGTTASFTVPTLSGSITTAGSGYVDASYTNVPLTNVTGTGSGAVANITVSQGTVTSVTITSNGSGYAFGNILSASNTNLGGSGSGFQYTISSYPQTISGFTISTYGTGYTSGNVLSLPSAVTGVTTFLPGSLTGVTTTLSSSSATITVSAGNAASITTGMEVNTEQGSVGVLAVNTTVLSVVGTTVTLSANPTTSGAATLTFSTPFADRTKLTVPSTANIQIGSAVSKTSGTGVLAANTTVVSIDNSTTVTISQQPTTPGSATISFTPPYGSGSSFAYTISGLGKISTFSVSDGGLGYTLNDALSIAASDLVAPITYTVTYTAVRKLDFTTTISTSSIAVNDILEVANATGISTVSIQTGTPTGAANTYTNVAQASTTGSGTGARFTISKTSGASANYTVTAITTAGSGYAQGDTIVISGTSLGGASPANDLTLNATNVVQSASGTVVAKQTSGGNITFINLLPTTGSIISGSVLRKQGTTTPTFTVNTTANRVKYYIDTGSGAVLHPSLTLYKDSTYIFDITGVSSHPFYFSIHPDGNQNQVTGITTTLSNSSPIITVSSSTGILVGMEVTVTSGTGALIANGTSTVVTVVSINGNQITLSSSPYTSGPATLTFSGAIYAGSEITRTNSALTIKPTATTPTLYYFCNGGVGHEDEAGVDGQEAVVTINQNNPKVFGSGFAGYISGLDTQDLIKGNISNGQLTATGLISDALTVATGQITTLVSTSGTITNLTTSNVSGTSITLAPSSNLTINTPTLTIGSNISIDGPTGNITTAGTVKTTGSLNINDSLIITNANIQAQTTNDIVLTPASNRVAKISSSSALIIPSGSTSQRPTTLAENGAIRFNTQTSQYEGYSAATSSWSSLGGVRDLDGNTYIAAEASVGANDNTLYFYNDGNNTLKLTSSDLIFNTVKTIDSVNLSNPVSTLWVANTPVTLGTYLYYKLNVYEVTTAGTTGGPASAPTHTAGTVVNGTAQLTWYAEYSDDLTFDQVKNVVINTNLLFKNNTVDELKLYANNVTTITSDLILTPATNKKVDINSSTSLVIPNGSSAQRGTPDQGSIRYNTDLTQFEGYNGVSWTSLGGVRDVDGNTYIIPETAPGANENILYFYNNGSNTLRLSTTELTFNTIDQIGSTNNNLDLQAQTVTFNSLALTIDNSGTSTKFLSTKTNFDLALSVGLYTNPLIRLNTTGDIYVNKGFGTATDSYIKVLDNELKLFELDDVKIETQETNLTKGTTNSGAFVIFDPTLHSGAKVVIVANNTTTDHRELIEFTVVAKGTDIFHTEYGNVTTGSDIITPVFDFDGSSRVRLTATLVADVVTGNVVNLTVSSTVIKK